LVIVDEVAHSVDESVGAFFIDEAADENEAGIWRRGVRGEGVRGDVDAEVDGVEVFLGDAEG